jgi:hypothetical protein
MRLQKLIPVRQKFPERKLPDVREATLGSMRSATWTAKVEPGSRIAVGVGSRGISNIDVMAKAVVDFWIERGCQPFIIPVMGSHGGASGEGQANVLAHYGISEATMGVPIVSSLDVVQIGETPDGIAVSMDRQAYEADGVMLLSRVKWHTSFEGKIESGVHKMMAIGLGKWEGAKRYHAFALRLGMEHVIRSVGKVVLDTGRMLGGLAILEDAHHNTAEVHALGADGMLAEEEILLDRTKSWKAGLPFAEIDLLIIDEMGKNISGTGSDTKVMNRGLLGKNTLPGMVKIQRVFTRDLTPESGGNATGIGLCDVIADRLYDKIDFPATWVNAFTSSILLSTMCPPHFADDRTCVEKIIMTCGKLDPTECSIAHIRNTMELGEFEISEALLPEIANNPDIEVIGEARELGFDATGALAPVVTGSAIS